MKYLEIILVFECYKRASVRSLGNFGPR